MVQTSNEYVFDRGIDADPPPDLYCPAGVAEGIDGFAAFGDEQVAFFREQGYLVIHRAFTPVEAQAAIDGLLDLIDGRNPAYTGLQFEAGARALLPTLTREQKQDAIRKVDRFADYDPRLRAIVHHPALLDALGRLLGAPAELAWDQALLKPPHIGREKPWHQDHSMFDFARDTAIVGTWLALDPATLENGCMHIIPGSHCPGPVVHFQRRDFQICDADVAVARVLAAPLEPGGLLLFDGLLHHGTPPNRSPRRRRAIQCHYTRRQPQLVTREERLALWGEEGKDVRC